MPTILTNSDVSFTTRFILNTTPKKFSLIDNTDYAGASIPLTNVFGCITSIVSPSGITIYQNATYTSIACDIYPNTSTTQQTTVALPSLQNNSPEIGTYEITYTVSINDGTNPTYQISKTTEYEYDYSQPTAVISALVDCYAPYLTGTDETNYDVNGITPTNTRTIVYAPPSGSGGSSINNTTSATITTSTFYTGISSFTVTSVLSYTFDDGLIVIDTVTGVKSITVDCNLVCDTFCCINDFNTRMENWKSSNYARYEENFDDFVLMMSKVTLLQEAIHCGKQGTANSIMTQIKTIANCTDNCNCSDGTPRLVQGIGTTNVNVVVASGGSPVTVTSATVSGITTYTISLTSAFINLVNASYNSIVVAGDSSVTVTPSGTNPKTYSIIANYTAAQNRMEFTCTLAYTNFAVPAVTITNSAYLYSGTNINATASVSATDIANPNWATMNNLFTCSGFQVSTNTNYKVTADVFVQGADYSLVGGVGTWTAAQMKGLYDMLQVQILNKTSGSFDFRLVMASGGSTIGVPVSNKYMVAFPDIKVNIKISQ